MALSPKRRKLGEEEKKEARNCTGEIREGGQGRKSGDFRDPKPEREDSRHTRNYVGGGVDLPVDIAVDSTLDPPLEIAMDITLEIALEIAMDTALEIFRPTQAHGP